MKDINEIKNNPNIISFLLIRSLKPLILKCQLYEEAAKLSDKERHLSFELEKEFNLKTTFELADCSITSITIDVYSFLHEYGVKSISGIESNQEFMTLENYSLLIEEFDKIVGKIKMVEIDKIRNEFIAKLRSLKIDNILKD